MDGKVNDPKSASLYKTFGKTIVSGYALYGSIAFVMIIIISVRFSFVRHFVSNLYAYFEYCCGLLANIF